jgi:hypothetical protein
LTSELERSPVFKIASSKHALAMTVGFRDGNADGPDDVVIVASRPTSGP